MNNVATAHLPVPASDSTAGTSTPTISTHQLFMGSNTLRIEHHGQCYQLRITRENKLILTK